MKRESLAPIVFLMLVASCNSAQPSDDSAENVATDYGTAVDASALDNEADVNDAATYNVSDTVENKADAIDRSEPDNDVTVRNKQQ